MASSRYDFQKILRGGASGDIMSAFPQITSSDLQSSNDIFVRLQYGQRVDNLAYKYLGDGQYWWVICLMNNLKTPFDQNLVVGKILRVPTSLSKIIRRLEDANI